MARSVNREERERRGGISALRKMVRSALTALSALDRLLTRLQQRKRKRLDESDLERIIKAIADFNTMADFVFQAIALLRKIFRF